MIGKSFSVALFLLIAVSASSILSFVLINLVLGCDTWDQEQWTPYKSCMTMGYIIGLD